MADMHYVLAGRDHPAMMPNLPHESTVLTWTRPVPGPGELSDPDLGMSNVSPPLERVWTVEKRDEKRGLRARRRNRRERLLGMPLRARWG